MEKNPTSSPPPSPKKQFHLRVYVAASYEDLERAKQFAATVRAAGHEVTSTWHDLPVKAYTDMTEDEHLATASRDLNDIFKSSAFVLLSTPPDVPAPRGGKFFELGVYSSMLAVQRAVADALLFQGRPVGLVTPPILVGKHENTFTRLAFQVDTLAEVVELLNESVINLA